MKTRDEDDAGRGGGGVRRSWFGSERERAKGNKQDFTVRRLRESATLSPPD